MNVASLEWVACFLVVSGVFFQLPNVRSRQVLFAAGSLGFLAAQAPAWPAWLLLGAFLGIGYLVTNLFARQPNQLIVAGYILLLVAGFTYIKQYAFLTALLPASLFESKIALVGVSYMLFRQIHLVVDAYQGQIAQFTFWNYLNYQLNLFGLLAGPIQRYQEFCEDWERLEPILINREEILKSYLRLFLGVIKVLGLGSLCMTAYSSVLTRYMSEPAGWRTIAEFFGMLYLFTAYLYFNFSGYCDIVIAGSNLLGLRMPENFNYPFVSRNIGDLWTRWHRTLGAWIRDYVFTPMFKTSVERWPSYATSLSFVAYFVAFLLAGIWHGSTWNFVVFGLLHGAGVAAAKIWEMILIRRRGRPGLKLYLQNPPIKYVAIIGTFHYFSFSLIFWSNDMATSMSIVKKLGAALTR